MIPAYEQSGITIYHGSAIKVLKRLPEASVNCVITSPPYWGLRDYDTGTWEGGTPECDHTYQHGVQGKSGDRADRSHTGQAVYKLKCRRCGAKRVDEQLGLEETSEEYIAKTVAIFREVRRVLRPDGTLWMVIGDSYCSDAGRDRQPTTKPGARVPSAWTNRAAPRRVHATRKGKDCDPKRGTAAMGQPIQSVCSAPGLKPKDMVGIPWMLAFALRADGWYLRSEIIWAKPNPMPESVTDRPTKAHEQIFLLAKSQRYYYDAAAIKEPVTGGSHSRGYGVNPKSAKWPNSWSAEDGRHDEIGNGRFRPRQNESFSAAVKDLVDERNKRSVWTVPTEAFPEAHFATYPRALIRPCVLAGCPPGGIVLDPFSGAATTALVAKENGRRCIGIELSIDYIEMSSRRLAQEVFAFSEEDPGLIA